MAQVIDGGYDAYNAVVHGIPTPSAIEYITSEFQRGSQVLQNLSQTMWQGAQELFNKYTSDEAIAKAKAAVRRVAHTWDIDTILLKMKIDEFQQAKPIMQRWIMAEPTTRSLYHKNLIDGYSDRYIDHEPHLTGEDHYDYRRVMDGIVVEGEDEDPWVATTYVDELLPDDGDLSLEDQTTIIETWKHLVWHIRQKGEDPTSSYNANMS